MIYINYNKMYAYLLRYCLCQVGVRENAEVQRPVDHKLLGRVDMRVSGRHRSRSGLGH